METDPMLTVSGRFDTDLADENEQLKQIIRDKDNYISQLEEKIAAFETKRN